MLEREVTLRLRSTGEAENRYLRLAVQNVKVDDVARSPQLGA